MKPVSPTITRNQHSQSGVALITALLIVSLVTVAAVAMASRQQLDIRRTANILQGDQAYIFALGGEAIAKQVLIKDKAAIDEMEDDWAVEVPPMPFKGGFLQFSMKDMAGLFNLNNLIDVDGKPSQYDIERFKNLIEVLKNKDDASEELKQAFTNDLANAVVDWIDADTDVLSGGAEDSDYLERERPYRAANRIMVTPSELMLVKGFTPVIYNALRPFVIALPVRTKLNVNTAKEEILRSLCKDYTKPDLSKLNRSEGTNLQSLLAGATQGGSGDEVDYDVFKNVNDFGSHVAFAGCDFIGVAAPAKSGKGTTPAGGTAAPAGGTTAGLPPLSDVVSVNSEYFLLESYAEVGPEDRRVRRNLYSLLQRKDGKVTSIMRAQGSL